MKSKVIIFLLLFIGSISFIAGSYSFYRLYDKSNRMEHTVGVVTDLKTERIYRNRKVRYKHTARIEYKTKRYSSHVRMQLYNPFIFQGSEISLWYYPDRTEEVVIPFEEGFIWGSMWIFGTFCLFLGIAITKAQRNKN